MKRASLILITLLTIKGVFAQTAKPSSKLNSSVVADKSVKILTTSILVSGSVIDSTGNAVVGATVLLKSTQDSLATASNSLGVFTFVNVKPEPFTITVSSLGYRTQTKTVKITGSSQKMVLDPFVLPAAKTVMSMISLKADTVYYRASDYKLNQNTSINSLLKRVEGISVAPDGSVTYNGQSFTKARLNGKDFYKDDMAQILKNLPADLRRQIQIVDDYGTQSSLSGRDNESYQQFTEKAFQKPVENPLSTFSVDVDAASYSNIRRYINNGQLPPKDAVRVEEMINYFSYNLPEPTGNKPVNILTELSAAPWNPLHRLLRISLKAKAVSVEKLPPGNLVFLVDVSGSMDQPNKLPLVKTAMKMLVDQLRPQDQVAIVVYAGNAGLVLSSTSGSQKGKIDSAINNLEAGGSTAGGAGLKLAYQIAKNHFKKDGNNRIIMATDGDFNVGLSSDESMEQLVSKEHQSGIDLSILGFGMGNLKDSKMEIMADHGNGNYAYIDNITEAHKALVTEFGGTLFTVAKDVKLQVEFNPAKVQAYRLIGYDDRMLAKEDFNNDKKDAGDMGAGHDVTAFYEIVPAGITDEYIGTADELKYQKIAKTPALSSSEEMLTVKFRYKEPGTDASKLSEAIVLDKPIAFDRTTADYRFAAAVTEFGLLLRDSEFKQKATYEEAITIAESAKADDKDGYRSELIRLMKTANLMSKERLSVVK